MDLLQIPQDELIQNGRVYSCGIYYPRQHANHWKSEISKDVWRCKYRDPGAIDRCVALMRRMLKTIVNGEPTIITFVPGRPNKLPTRLHARSAAEPLAREIVRLAHANGTGQMSLAELLCYARMTPKLQHQCTSHRERRENITGCYAAVHPEITQGASIIVIDDVLTSGATMRECQRVLLKAGAFDVRGLVLARTVGW